jgi:hypothetical protein
MSTLDTILARLRDGLGLSSEQAAGVAGNLQVESGFSSTAYNPNEGAIGLAQWEKGRRTNLQRFAAARGSSETDLNTQVDFLISELQGPEAGALADLRNAGDAATAAAVFDKEFERSAGTSRDKRIAAAQAIASGHPSFAGVSSSGSAATSPGTIAASLGGGLLSGWAPAAFTVGIKVLGVGAAAALVIVGAVHTVSK